ncbi:MAG: RraA family protein [Bilophila wadsworthia]
MTPDARLLSDPVGTMSGVALTVKARPGDSLMIHKALNMAEEGDVLIVSGGESGRSLMGELMFRYAASKKLAGIVVDGPIRDADCLRGFPLPVYASGFTPGGPYREGPGEINVPVVCCGQSVEPGDILLGDRDGVIVIPSGDAASLYDAARQSMSGIWRDRECPPGAFDRGWVDGAGTEGL